ncbi:MAG: hypothetical protein UY72_C0072G0010 [Candidatus Uhrbacteria bacterium GW2011_GWD2_52_7]|uniref:Uncharacterized protein n=1 Tax=Candidatus Uhrbacteria bacterium GW2011_GWD2_52_7 TaxID=1618989 RepID=A0A0G1XC41_9BACT|nr:MAG: hypothetical protein UY72_C0072G0010 [Candidatus Uhrbacteria bacterium GW2011_GWD2_52_7]
MECSHFREQDIELSLERALQFSAARKLISGLILASTERDADRAVFLGKICLRWRYSTKSDGLTYAPDHLHGNVAVDCRLGLLGAACRLAQSPKAHERDKADLALKTLLTHAKGALQSSHFHVYDEAVDLLCEAWEPHLCGTWRMWNLREPQVAGGPELVDLVDGDDYHSIFTAELPATVEWSSHYHGFVPRSN